MSPNRPSSIRGAAAIVYDWLAANGVDEWIPDKPTITVTDTDITYTAYVWPVQEERGFNDAMLFQAAVGEAATTDRTVPLAKPLTPGVRAACEVVGVTLIEEGRT